MTSETDFLFVYAKLSYRGTETDSVGLVLNYTIRTGFFVLVVPVYWC